MKKSLIGKVVVLDNCGDDAEVGVGGTIANLTQAGWEVIIGRFNKPNANTSKGTALLKAKEEWLEFRGRESGAIRHGQIDRGLFAEAFAHFPMPLGHKRMLLPGTK
jgi:hypothetical protein